MSRLRVRSILRDGVRRLARAVVPSAAAVRLTAYGVFACSTLGLLAARSVRADVTEMSLAASHELLRLGDLTGGAEALTVNGATLHRASVFTDQSVTEVLDRYQAYCAASPGALGQVMRDIPKALRDDAIRGLPMPSLALGVFREESAPNAAKGSAAAKKARGMVACFVDEGAAAIGAAAGTKARLQRFIATGDLSAFGKMRHVYAETASDGSTHVVTTWTDGELVPSRMFPAQGDAIGTDSPFLPRPPSARRILTGSAEGMPYGVRVYASTAPPEELWATYGGFLEGQGLKRVPGADDEATRTWLRDDSFQVSITVADQDGQRFVTLLESGRAGVSHVTSVEVDVPVDPRP